MDSFGKVILNLILSPLILVTLFSNASLAKEKDKNINNRPLVTTSDLQTYYFMGGVFLCRSLLNDIDFKTAQKVSIMTVQNILVTKHERKALDPNNKEITLQDSFLDSTVPFFVTADAVGRCPDKIPKETKKIVNEELKKLKKLEKSIKKKKK